MDEPCSALDAEGIERIETLIQRVAREVHDPDRHAQHGPGPPRQRRVHFHAHGPHRRARHDADDIPYAAGKRNGNVHHRPLRLGPGTEGNVHAQTTFALADLPVVPADYADLAGGRGVVRLGLAAEFYIDRTADDLQARAWLAEERSSAPCWRPATSRRSTPCARRWAKKAGTRLTVVLPDGKVVGDSSGIARAHGEPRRSPGDRRRPGRAGRAFPCATARRSRRRCVTWPFPSAAAARRSA